MKIDSILSEVSQKKKRKEHDKQFTEMLKNKGTKESEKTPKQAISL